MADGAAVTTVEGVGNTDNAHPVQERIAKLHGSQCGFCTPGFVMSLYAALRGDGDATRKNPPSPPSSAEMERACNGNICRCTGYRPLLDAARTFGADYADAAARAASDAAKATAIKTDATTHIATSADKLAAIEPALPAPAQPAPADTARDPAAVLAAFPPELLRLDLGCSALTLSSHPGTVLPDGTKGQEQWLRPTTLIDLARLHSERPHARVVGGEVDFTRGARLRTKTFLDPGAVAEMNTLGLQGPAGPLRVGFCVTPRELIALCSGQAAAEALPPPEPWGPSHMLAQALLRFASPQARAATAVGSIVDAVDVSPALRAVGCRLELARYEPPSATGIGGSVTKRVISLSDGGFDPQVDVLVALLLDVCPETVPGGRTFYGSFKAGPKPTQAPGTVTLSLRSTVGGGEGRGPAVVSASIFIAGVFQGGHRRTISAVKAAEALRGLPLEECGELLPDTVWEAFKVDLGETPLSAVGKRKHDDLNEAEDVESGKGGGDESDSPGLDVTSPADAEFRRALARSALFRAVANLARWASGAPAENSADLSAEAGAYEQLADDRTGASFGMQTFTVSKSSSLTSTIHTADPHHSFEPARAPVAPDAPNACVGQPIPHVAALQQCTGEALFVDDLDPPRGHLEAAMVSSTRPHAVIKSVDPAAALALDGVHGYFDYRDLADRSLKGKQRVADDKDRVFTQGLTTCVGMLIAIVVAETESLARKAASLVKVEYEDLPAVLSIDEALASIPPSLHSYNHCVVHGNVDSAMAAAPRTLTGEGRVGAQEHFYLEPHVVMAAPEEHRGEMTIYSCTQCVAKTVKIVAGCLGVQENKVRCIVKRIGGGFGGKETLSMFRAGAVAVAANKLRRAVRLCMTREEDMLTSGQSHPFLGRWKVGFDESGRLLAVDVDLVCNGGSTICCSNVVMDRGLSHFQNAYHFPALRAVGRIAYTHLTGNTAFRGFGVPQSAMICEQMVEAVARALRVHPEAVRRANLLQSHTRMSTGQLLGECHLARIWSQLDASAGTLVARRQACEEHNARHRWSKRGLSMVPTCYGVNFPLKYLNQAASYVLVYTDGSVLVTHGGTEMGQGLNTKVIQIAAQCFSISVDLVRIAECASDRIHNTSPTAASMGSDLNGMATLNACEQIFERVKELLPGGRDYRPHPSLPPTYPHYGWVTACYWAYQRQISLGALGFYGSPFGGTYKWRAHSLDGDGRVSVSEPGEVDNAGRGEVYNYYAFGAACAEVELDVLTGNWRFLRADLLMDVGESLNAAIDVGQVEGAFVQGVGRWTSESVVWVDGAHAGLGPAGSLHTDSPHRYFVPGAADAPRDFRVTLLGGAPNPRAVHSSKAVGEPPFFLSSAAYFALKDAVRAARTDAVGEDEGGAYVQLHAPLTAERLRMACRDRLSRPEKGRGEYVANCTSY